MVKLWPGSFEDIKEKVPEVKNLEDL